MDAQTLCKVLLKILAEDMRVMTGCSEWLGKMQARVRATVNPRVEDYVQKQPLSSRLIMLGSLQILAL